MTILHRADIPDHGKDDHHIYITDLTCNKCGKQLEAGDPFVVRDDGYKARNEFTPCTEVQSND